MDLGSAMVGIIIMLIILTPFVLLKINSNKKRKLQLQTLFSFAEKNDCKLHQYEMWINASIGLDELKHKVFFVRKEKETDTFQQVGLNEIVKCQVINSNRTLNNKEGVVKIFDKIKLSFTPKDKNKPDIVFECYNAAYDNLTLSGELQVAEKWCAVFNSKIKSITR